MFSLKHMCSCVCMHVSRCIKCMLVIKHMCMCVGPCSCMCVHPRGPWAVQRMSRGCGGSGGVGSVTQRGRWWDRTAFQQRGTLQHQTRAGFEYCIRALELSPRTPKAPWSSSLVLNPCSGGRHHRASASVDLITLELDRDSSSAYFTKSYPSLSVSHSLPTCVCLCKCDDMLGRCYCEERETELPLHSACLSSGWPQSCILDQTQNHKAQCVWSGGGWENRGMGWAELCRIAE